MMTNKIIYWIATGLVGAMMLFSAFSYLTNEEIKGAFVHLGFPNFFRVELAILKFIGAAALLLPIVPGKFKEMAYWGFGLTFISAFVAHTAVGDATQHSLMPLIFLAILVISYIYFKKANK
ncbi:DoxX family protein [Olivibacter domesticus]|uniref:DoxX-like family protein n=1 Tax=Olivibacter domesticus TaxID=407022 RepID=A0A1H7W3D8_OLID1|nr:DoxX family protein [Olivibacter domesticus]SEM16010.1 DoxX-like family protein [Olivibacter domesticus]